MAGVKSIRRALMLLVILFMTFGIRVNVAAYMKVHTSLMYHWWEGSESAQGRQVYLPIQIVGEQRNFFFRMLTGYVSTKTESQEQEDRTVTDILDTKVNTSYEILEVMPVDIILGLDVNLPTGRTGLEPNHPLLDADPDLLAIKGLGEGVNINPTITFATEWGRWVGGLGCGYLWRGKYDYSKEIKEYDPGDIINLSAEIRYDYSSYWEPRLFSDYAYYFRDTIGVKSSREGSLFVVGLGLHYDQLSWDSDISLQRLFRERGDISEHESPGDEWIGELSYNYSLNDKTRLKSFLELLWHEDTVDKKKYSLKVRITRLLKARLEAGINMKGFLMRTEDEDFKGFSLGADVVKGF
ncbi:MAG: hypothetical protein ACMUJM_20505 [bacterium]